MSFVEIVIFIISKQFLAILLLIVVVVLFFASFSPCLLRTKKSSSAPRPNYVMECVAQSHKNSPRHKQRLNFAGQFN